MEPEPIGRRTTLTKKGSPDISLELRQTEQGGFSYAENGKWGVTWPKYSPEQLMSGDTPRRTLDEVWKSLVDNYLAKYPGYSTTVVENLLPAA